MAERRQRNQMMKSLGLLGASDDEMYAPICMDTPPEITLKDIVLHLQAMEQRLTKNDARLEKQIERVERNLSGQIDAIDQRLDAIEIENLPKRVKKLERTVGIA